MRWQNRDVKLLRGLRFEITNELCRLTSNSMMNYSSVVLLVWSWFSIFRFLLRWWTAQRFINDSHVRTCPQLKKCSDESEKHVAVSDQIDSNFSFYLFPFLTQPKISPMSHMEFQIWFHDVRWFKRPHLAHDFKWLLKEVSSWLQRIVITDFLYKDLLVRQSTVDSPEIKFCKISNTLEVLTQVRIHGNYF